MMTKEDYMYLPKARLAEMLVERDKGIVNPSNPINIPYIQIDNTCPNTGGLCTNPFHDCINCLRRGYMGVKYETTSTAKLADKEEK